MKQMQKRLLNKCTQRDMSKRTGNESVFADTGTKKRRLETTSEGSSAHTESEHLFNDMESDDASTQGKLENPSVDNDSK